MRPPYEALVLDVDGTLVGASGHVHPKTREAVRALAARGVPVLIATGRSELGTLGVLEELGLDTPAVVFNGAGIWCPKRRTLVEERVLSNRAVARVLAFAEREGLLTVVMRGGEKFATRPTDTWEAAALRDMLGLEPSDHGALPREYLIRISLFSQRHGTSADFVSLLEREVDLPLYLTDFPLNHLASHPDSPLQVVDVQPPCRGKGEVLRLLAEEFGIPPERVVAIGDGGNDVPMLLGAGLGVAMEVSLPEALAAADRIIGSCDGPAIAELVDELFPA